MASPVGQVISSGSRAARVRGGVGTSTGGGTRQGRRAGAGTPGSDEDLGGEARGGLNDQLRAAIEHVNGALSTEPAVAAGEPQGQFPSGQPVADGGQDVGDDRQRAAVAAELETGKALDPVDVDDEDLLFLAPAVGQGG